MTRACQHFAAGGGEKHGILDADAEIPLDVDARLDGEDHALLQHHLALLRDRRRLVYLVANPVAEGVAEAPAEAEAAPTKTRTRRTTKKAEAAETTEEK